MTTCVVGVGVLGVVEVVEDPIVVEYPHSRIRWLDSIGSNKHDPRPNGGPIRGYDPNE